MLVTLVRVFLIELLIEDDVQALVNSKAIRKGL